MAQKSVGLNAGDMDAEIILQTAPAVQGDSGELTYDFAQAVSVTLWAEWLPEGSVEAFRAQQRLGAYVSGVFRIYDRVPRPTSHNTRILYDGRVFDVQAYLEIGERGEGLALPVIARDDTR